MIRVEISNRNFESDRKMRAYVEQKIGDLEKYLPRQVRESVTATVVLEEDRSGREDNSFVCEAIISINGDTLMSKEGTINIYAAVDIVEAKLKAQLRTYKEKHTTEPRRARMLGRLMLRRDPRASDDLAPEAE